MKLRKLFAWLMTLVMLLGMVPTAQAEVINCDHNWAWRWPNGQPVNCQDWKWSEKYCTKCGVGDGGFEQCGPCVPGDKTWVIPQASNCQEHGVWEITCKYCGEWLEGMEEPGPHKWSETVVEEPWCDVGGMKAVICSVCGEWQNNGTPLNPLGHDWGDWRWVHGYEPTCAEGAWRARECKRCDRMEDEWVPATGAHKWQTTTVEQPTCTEGGLDAEICSVCGQWADNGVQTPALGHDWGDWEWDGEPSCIEGGWKHRNCKRCRLREEEAVDAIGSHSWGDWVIDEKPTCTQKGLKYKPCVLCGKTEWLYIDMIDHNFGEWHVIEEPQVGIPGTERRACIYNCGTHEDREIPALEEALELPGLGLELTLDSTPANGEYFVVGEKVVFTVSWVNNSSETLLPFYVSIWPYEQPSRDSQDLPYSCSFDAEEPITPGMTGSHSMVTTVTEEDVARGGIYAMAYIWSSVHNGPEVEEVTTPFVTAPCGAEGASYATSIELEVLDVPSVTAEWAGDVYTAKVKVTNTGDTTISLYAYQFSDSNNEYYPNAIKYSWNKYQDDPRADWLHAGESLTTDIEFAVTQDGIAAGELRFNFTQFAIPWYVEVGNVETNIPADIVAEPEGTTGYYGKRDEEVAETVEIVVPINQGTAEFDPEGLTVTKTASAGDYSDPCKPGDEVTFTITVTNNTGVELHDVEITDPIKGGNEDAVLDRIASMQPGESVTAAFSYTVTEEDATVGVEGFENTAYATGYTADGTQVSGTSNTVFVWCVVEHSLTFSKSIANVPANGVFFVPGETIVFNISMFNHTPYPLYNITLTDPLCQDQYTYDAVNDMSYLYFGELYNEGNAMGESTSATVTVSYVVTEADAEAGSVTNTAEVTYQTWYGKDMTASASATAPCGVGEPMNSAGVRLEKALRNAPANGEYYVPGEVLNYALTLRLDDGLLLDDAAIYDPIAGGDGLVISYGKGLYGGMGMDVFYVVTEEDAQRGYVENTAYATWIYQDSGEAGRCESETVIAICGMGELPDDYQAPGSVRLTLTEWSTPANGTHYVPGERINVHFRLYNNSRDVTMTIDHEHYFLLCGDGAKEGDDSFSSSEVLMPGSGYSVYWWPRVTEADAARGYVEMATTYYLMGDDGNEYTATGSIRLPCGPGELPDDYVPPVIPDIDGDGIPNEEDPDIDGDGTPNGEDPDIDGDGIPNGDDPDVDGDGIPNEEDPDADGDGIPNEEDPTPDADMGLSSALNVTKSVTSTPANGSFYVPGETVTFNVHVVNTGDPLNNLHVSDWMWAQSLAFGTINTNEDVSFPVSYTVTELDAITGSVSNIAFAEAVAANGDPVMEYSNDVTVSCGFPEGEDPFGILTGLEITKAEESLPLNGSYYTEGETVAYKITYTNIGEMPLTDVIIYDAMGGMSEIATAETLNPSESRVCWLNHTVTAVDVSRGYISNTAVGQFELNGWVNTASSNTVTVDTNGKQDLWTVHPFWPGEDPEYDPDTGWFPDSDPALEGDTPPFGTIDTDALHSGETYCVRTITDRDNVSVSYETGFCAVHGPVQASALLMQQAAATPEMQVQAAAYATALWRSEVEKLYQELMASADPTAQAVLMTEYIRFVADIANYEAMLKVLHPDQPALAASKVVEIWENKCIDLCYDTHAAADERKDSLLAVTPTTGAAAVSCTCEVTAQEADRKAIVQRYCAMHGFPFSMTDALLRGNDTADAWTMVRQIWGVELTSAYNKLYAAMGENKLLAMAEQHALTQWMMAREASLIALYPDNPEVVVQLMTKLIMARVNELCQMTN